MRRKKRAAFAAAVLTVLMLQTASGILAGSSLPATEFGTAQSGIAIGITSRSVPAAGGAHVLINITTKNTSDASLTLAPIVEARLAVVDPSGKDVPGTDACPSSAATPQPFEVTFEPGEARIELLTLDLTCYAVKPGRDFAVTAFARVQVTSGSAGAADAKSVALQSNTIQVGLPDTLSLTTCPVPARPARVVKAVEPDYPLIARQEGLTGVAYVAVILDERGAVQESFIYRSSGARSLDEASLVAARRSQYAPEIKNCVPVAGLYIFRAEFARF